MCQIQSYKEYKAFLILLSNIKMTRSERITRSKTRAARLTAMSNIIQYEYGFRTRAATRSFTSSVHRQFQPLRVIGVLYPRQWNSKKPHVVYNGCLWKMI